MPAIAKTPDTARRRCAAGGRGGEGRARPKNPEIPRVVDQSAVGPSALMPATEPVAFSP